MWGRDGDPIYDKLKSRRKNEFIKLPKNVNLTSSLSEALLFSDIVFIIISAQAMKEVSVQIAATLKEFGLGNKTIIHCIKGIDEETNKTISQLLRSEFDAYSIAGMTINTWVGPGHIQENCINEQPAVMIIAGEDQKVAESIAEKFSSKKMKLYSSNDLIGAEIGATTKNVLGIAAGILEGIGWTSLKGALMARGCCEVSRLMEAMGGQKMTAYGLAHLGDFEATLFSRSSNNRKFGEVFIQNNQKIDGLPLAEGVTSSKSIYNLAKKHKVEMPICELVYEILHKGADPKESILNFFDRALKLEFCS